MGSPSHGKKRYKKYFQIKKDLNYTATKDKRNLFRQERETKAIKDRTLRDIKNLLVQQQEESHYEPVIFGVTISNVDRNKTLSVK